MERMESEKVELSFGLNAFNDPLEVSGAKAWANLISNLIFMSPGSMPSDPEMGIDIRQYEFMFIDDVKNDIEQNITDQVNTYFPDIPLESVTVNTDSTQTGRVILLIILSFLIDDVRDIAVVAAEKANSIINFEVSI